MKEPKCGELINSLDRAPPATTTHCCMTELEVPEFRLSTDGCVGSTQWCIDHGLVCECLTHGSSVKSDQPQQNSLLSFLGIEVFACVCVVTNSVWHVSQRSMLSDRLPRTILTSKLFYLLVNSDAGCLPAKYCSH